MNVDSTTSPILTVSSKRRKNALPKTSGRIIGRKRYLFK